MKLNIHKILIISALFILNSCSNERINESTNESEPISEPPTIAVKHSETEKFREIRIPSRNNF